MLSTDPGDGPGGFLSGEPPAGEPGGPERTAGPPARSPGEMPLRDIVPPAALANGGTILRPGAVAWDSRPGGRRPGGRYSSCEAVERALSAVIADPARLPGLLAELAVTRLWVPLPGQRPVTDGAAVRLPLVGYQGTEFVPCFTSVQRLSRWAGPPAQRAGDARAAAQAVPHIVVPAAGLAGRLPAGVGLALNPDSAPGLPLYPECVPYLARLTRPEAAARGPGDDVMEYLLPGSGARLLIGHPPAEPTALLAETRTALRALPAVSAASRAWLAVPSQGAGLVIAVGLDDPASDRARAAAIGAIERAATAAALRVPFTLDVTFPGEPAPGLQALAAQALVREPRAPEARAPQAPGLEAPAPGALELAAIDAWIARNTRPFYARA